MTFMVFRPTRGSRPASVPSVCWCRSVIMRGIIGWPVAKELVSFLAEKQKSCSLHGLRASPRMAFFHPSIGGLVCRGASRLAAGRGTIVKHEGDPSEND